MDIKYLNNYLKAGLCTYLDIDDAEVLAQMKYRIKMDRQKAKTEMRDYFERVIFK